MNATPTPTQLPPDVDFDAIPRARLMRIIAGAPKAELHMHIEGSLEPELIFAMARRNHVKLAYRSVDQLRAAYAFDDLQSFLDIYYAGASVLLTEQDFRDMAMAYYGRAADDNVVHVEMFFDPQTHTGRGIAIGTVIEGLHRARAEAQQRWGITSSLILCFLRHLPEDAAFATLESATPYRNRLAGVGLDSSERGHPPEKFARVFARARSLGLHAVAHAGEEGPPAYIESALDVLKAERIDHGVRCLEDAALVARLAASRTPLTVCPLSNVKLRVFGTMADHSLKRLLDAGLCVTINSDDPAYFGGYVNDNYRAAFEALPALDARDAFRLLANSFEASFIDGERKSHWIAQVEAAFRNDDARGLPDIG
jgi:adenosine deaminase